MRSLFFGLGVVSSLAVLVTPQPSKATALHFSVPKSAAVLNIPKSIVIENESTGPLDSVAEAILGVLGLYTTPNPNTLSLKMAADYQNSNDLNWDGTSTSSIISLVSGARFSSL